MSRRRFLGLALTAGLGVTSGLSVSGCSAAWRRSSRTRSAASRCRIVFFTDVHATTRWGAPEAVSRAADAINDAGADLILGGGDLIHGGFDATVAEAAPAWDVYMAFHRGLEGRVESAIGNHDLVAATDGDGRSARGEFQRRLGLDRSYRAFDACGRRVLLLDSVRVTGGSHAYEGGIDATQRDWLRSELERLDASTPIIVVTHMPLLTSFPAATKGWREPAPADRVITNSDEILALFKGRRLELVLQGHLHLYETLLWRGTTFVTGGAICGDWWKGVRLGTREGFCVIDLFEDRPPQPSYRSYGWTARRT
jgi:3',5'-cyclic AMP phosphodiesterase CpdA